MTRIPGRRRRDAARSAAALAVATLGLAGTIPAAAVHGVPIGRLAMHNAPVDARHQPHHHAWRSGVFVSDTGLQTYAETRQFGRWRGDPVRMVNDFAPALNWRDFARAQRIVSTWGHQNRVRLSLSVPMWTGNGSFARTAAGRDNHWFTAFAQRLVAAGLGHSVLRIGWEFNEAFYPWHVDSRQSAQRYIRAFRQIVRAVRAAHHEHFEFDWSPYDSVHGYRHVARAYPGDHFVDFIGEDVYDYNQRGRHQPAALRWHDLVHSRFGLAWQARFAERHHKLLSIPEWALVATPLWPGASGGDDVGFVRHMWRWFRHHDVAYENYFDAVGLTATWFDIDNHHVFPNASALYRRLWSRHRP